MTALRLRADAFGHFDQEVFRVYLNYVGRKAGVEWTLVPDGPADLLLWGQADVPQACAAPYRLLAWVLAPERSAPEQAGMPALTLRRPFQLESFSALLRAAERQLLAPVPVSAPEAPAQVPARPIPLPSAPPNTPGTVPQGEACAASPTAAAPARAAGQGHAVRLVRWPGRSLLSMHPRYPRLAGFLAARPLDVEQLSRLGGVDLATSLSFIRTLARENLLTGGEGWATGPTAPALNPFDAVVERATARPLSPAGSPGPLSRSPAAATLRPAAPPVSGLLARLRTHLGLA
ncbi:hypothetical protein [Ideonella livida]|uniref:Uncharacterized protein n=1 Tax=Ideonella livida TaxID=2707176 RepID=A0A7C9PHT1_9BURK|nr:hypothetical protein [Ideonella livida]NDY92333.1 hypothetical protein [Ideonella livida]